MNIKAVVWQERFAGFLPDGSRADWHEISREQYVEMSSRINSPYEYRALGVIEGKEE